MMTSNRPPAAWVRPPISPTRSSAASVLRPALARLCPSEAETTYSRSAIPAPVARFAPLTLATSADHRTSGQRYSAPATRSASAMLGTARGETNDVASIRRTPVAARASSMASLASRSIGRSSCSPSRGPTSRRSTDGGNDNTGMPSS